MCYRIQITSSAVLGAPFLSPSRVAAAANDDSSTAAAATAAPYLMKEYYAQDLTTAASYGRFFFPTLTSPAPRIDTSSAVIPGPWNTY
jgi:hypothetical protein